MPVTYRYLGCFQHLMIQNVIMNIPVVLLCNYIFCAIDDKVEINVSLSAYTLISIFLSIHHSTISCVAVHPVKIAPYMYYHFSFVRQVSTSLHIFKFSHILVISKDAKQYLTVQLNSSLMITLI